MINVLVVDDRHLTHRLMETYLKPEDEIEIIGFAENGRDAIERIGDLQPDVVLMDVEMPEMDGLTATKIITQKFVATKVLILTVHDNEQHLKRALENGAKGYLLKNSTPQELKTAIRYVDRGYFQLSVELIEKYLQKILGVKPESEEIYDLKRKVSDLDESLDRLEVRFNELPTQQQEDIQGQIKQIIRKEIAKLGDRESHLQFKIDRIDHTQQRLKQNIKYLFVIQLGCIIIALIAIACAVFSYFN